MLYIVRTLMVCIPLVVSCAPTESQTPNDKSISQIDLSETKIVTEIITTLTDNPAIQKPYLVAEKNFFTSFYRTELFDVFNTILKNNAYRNDPAIRSKLRTLSETHPFTDIRASARLVLSEFSGDQIPPMFQYARVPEGYKGPTARDINKEMEYCAPPSNARRPDFEYEAEKDAETLRASTKKERQIYVRPNYRFKVPLQNGTLSGGYYTIHGVGLTYELNTPPYKTVTISADNNRYVMQSGSKNTYWLIDGPHHMIGGGSITRLVETQDGVERYLHRVLPGGVSQIFILPDGELFISFVNLDPSKRGGVHKETGFEPFPLENYNPPVIFYPDGTISLACTAKAIKF